MANDIAAVRAAVQPARLTFLAENGQGPVVRLEESRSAPAWLPVEDLNAEDDE
jgi:hypothetical protein